MEQKQCAEVRTQTRVFTKRDDSDIHIFVPSYRPCYDPPPPPLELHAVSKLVALVFAVRTRSDLTLGMQAGWFLVHGQCNGYEMFCSTQIQGVIDLLHLYIIQPSLFCYPLRGTDIVSGPLPCHLACSVYTHTHTPRLSVPKNAILFTDLDLIVLPHC